MREPVDSEHWPLRQVLSVHGEAAAGWAGQDLLDALAPRSRFRIVRHAGGGVLHAASPAALVEGRNVLRAIYGEAVRFGEPTIAPRPDPAGGGPQLPVYFVRIDAPRREAPRILARLRQEGLTVQQAAAARNRAVLRLEASAAQWLRLERDVVAAAQGEVQCLAWLLRYEPVPA